MFHRKTSLSACLALTTLVAGMALGQAEDLTSTLPALPPIPPPPIGTWVGLRPNAKVHTSASEVAAPQLPEVFEVIKIDPDKPFKPDKPVMVMLAAGLEERVIGWVFPEDILPADEAMATLDSRIRDNPGDARLLLDHGLLESGTSSLLETIESISDHIRLDPRNADHYHQRGRANEGRGDNVRAFGDLFEAIRFNPDRVEFYQTRARVALKLKAYHRAVQDATKALRVVPGDIPLLLIRAQANAGLLAFQMAINDYQAVLRRDPTNQTATENLRLAQVGLASFPSQEDVDIADSRVQVVLEELEARGDAVLASDDTDPSSVEVPINTASVRRAQAVLGSSPPPPASNTPKRLRIVSEVGKARLIEAYLDIASKCELRGNADKAKKAYENVLKLNPDIKRASEYLKDK